MPGHRTTNKMKRYNLFLPLVLFFTLLSSSKALAQQKEEDLEALLNSTEKPKKEIVKGTFKATHVINLQSPELVSPGTLQFMIQHRFGPLNGGTGPFFNSYQFYGLDAAGIRFGFEYGVCKRLSVGVGRSSLNKNYDGYVKATLLQQSKGGNGAIPFSVTYFGSVAATSLLPSYQSEYKYLSSRFAYTNQIIIASKVSERFSFEVVPTFIHFNQVVAATDPNDYLAIGFGARFKLSKRVSFNAEYIYRIPPKDKLTPAYAGFYNSMSFGFDIETGGHVFQLMVTNSLGMYEASFITQTNQRWGNGGIQLGFNISRDFVLNRKKVSGKNW